VSNAAQSQSQAGAAAGRVPLLTVGMPVYNGLPWIEPALDSLLAQTFEDFVLLVCDNASSDDTERLVREYAQRDSRVRYHRNRENVGVYRNYNKAFSFADTRYFKWASANDLCAPEFLEECIALLEAEAQAVLAYPGTIVFRDAVEDGEEYAADPDIRDARPSTRFRRALDEIGLNNALNGVIRTDALARTLLNRVHARSDVALIAELALAGKICKLERHLFHRRMDPSASSSAKDADAAEQFFAAEGRDIHRRPSWDYYRTCFRMALRGPVSPAERLRCAGIVARMCWWNRAELWREATGRGSRRAA
jgi:glycosyltransferase involved in cell wall biosynthesis